MTFKVAPNILSVRSRVFASGFLFLLLLLWPSCGDTYRPVAQPIIGPLPDPSAFHFVISVAQNWTGSPGNVTASAGSASHLDVSGDSNSGNLVTGVLPVHAALTPNGSRLYVVNKGEDSVTVNTTTAPTTVAAAVTLLSGSQPTFVHTTENANVYVANSGNNTVSVINTTTNVVTATIPVDGSPAALAETPNAQKLYVANQGSNNVTVIAPQFASLASSSPILVGAPQVWATARADNLRVYVLDTAGLIHDIDTASDTDLGTVSGVGSGANFMTYDKVFNRLFVTNPSAATLTILDASTDLPLARPAIFIPPAASSGCSTATLVPTSVTVLGDGSRAYVAGYQVSAGTVCTQLTVIDTGTGAITTTIPLSQSADQSAQNGCNVARFRVFTTSSGGGTNTRFKVFVSQCDAGNVAVVYAFASGSNPADTYNGAAVPAPLSSFPSQIVNISAANQTPAAGSSPATTTYTYTMASGTGLSAGTAISITGMDNHGNDGNFMISRVSSGTFTVSNPSGVTATNQNGSGLSIPFQNPVFLVAGP
jgi:YVTN family beta-propeller protein